MSLKGVGVVVRMQRWPISLVETHPEQIGVPDVGVAAPVCPMKQDRLGALLHMLVYHSIGAVMRENVGRLPDYIGIRVVFLNKRKTKLEIMGLGMAGGLTVALFLQRRPGQIPGDETALAKLLQIPKTRKLRTSPHDNDVGLFCEVALVGCYVTKCQVEFEIPTTHRHHYHRLH